MTEGMQRLIIALAIGGALAYLARRLWRQAAAAKQRTGSDCGPDCGCGKH